MDNAALIAVATALELEMEPIRKELESIANEPSTAVVKERLEAFDENLPLLLAAAVAGTYAANALESAMATHYAEGVSAFGMVKNTGKLMRAEKAYDAIHESGILLHAVNDIASAEADISTRASAVAKIVKGQIVQDIRNAIARESDEDSIQAAVQEAAESLSDLSGNQHVVQHVEIQTAQAKGYGKFSALQTEKQLAKVSYQELYRAENRHEWRPWPEIWAEQGGSFYKHGPSDYPEGRLIAPIDSSIWVDISDFGTPYAPLKYGSGMDLRPVPKEQLSKLGLAPKLNKPRRLSFNAAIKFSVDFDEDVKQVLLDGLQDWQESRGELQEKT